MKWISTFLVGYVLLIAGVTLALWKWGLLEDLGAFWSTVIALIALGAGVMISVAKSGRKEQIEIDRN